MLEQILSRIDLLGLPIILNFSRAKKVRSSFGGSWTLVFLGFVLWALYNSGNELWEKKKPTINQGVIFNTDLEPVELSSGTVPMMVYTALNPIVLSEAEWEVSYLNDYEYYTTYADYVADLESQYNDAAQTQCNYTYLIHEDASSNGITGAWLDMELCTKDHFAGFNGIIDSETESLMARSYCLPIKTYGEVYGFSISARCGNGAYFFDQNPTVELFYPKYGLSLQNYTHPIQPYFYNYRIPLQPSHTGTTYSYWSLNYLGITTDNGWLTTSYKTDHYVQVAPAINPAVNADNNRIEDVFIFKLSKEEIFYTRTYTKLQGVLADVGGLAGSVLALLLIVITPFARVKLSEAFVNEMFEPRTEHEPKTLDEKRNSQKSKRHSKGNKSVKVANKPSFDGNAIKKDNLQTLEMEERNSKDPSKGSIPIKSQNYQIPGDESPFFKAGRIADPQHSQAEGVRIPQGVKKNFSECEEISTPVQSPVQSIKPNPVKGGFALKNPFNGDQDKNNGNGIEVQDLENPEISPELPPIETPSKTELDGDRDGEEEQMREQGDIEAQQDFGRNANEVIAEDQSRKLQKNGVFGTMQLALPTKPKKIQKPKIIKIGFFEYLLSFLDRSPSTRQKIKILNQGLDMLERRLDVFNLLKKMRDIDKVKGLIFDKDQLFLFDRLPRPDIKNPSTHWYQEDYLSYYEIFKGANELEELELKAQIKDSKRTLENKPQKSEVDERILVLM